jgi:hypothetical protein
MTRLTGSALVLAAALAAGETALIADVLILRDGRRIEGVLTGVRGNTIEFEHRGGREDGRVRQYDRDDVRSVQFDEPSLGSRLRDDNRGVSDLRSRSGLRERVVSVDARTQWTDAGVDVRGGQEMIFSGNGEVRWGPGRRDGAAGERNSEYNNGRPMPDRPAAALIGKIGENGDPFFIGGSAQPIRVRGSGRLFLGLNDDYLLDNAGFLRVTVLY